MGRMFWWYSFKVHMKRFPRHILPEAMVGISLYRNRSPTSLVLNLRWLHSQAIYGQDSGGEVNAAYSTLSKQIATIFRMTLLRSGLWVGASCAGRHWFKTSASVSSNKQIMTWREWNAIQTVGGEQTPKILKNAVQHIETSVQYAAWSIGSCRGFRLSRQNSRRRSVAGLTILADVSAFQLTEENYKFQSTAQWVQLPQ